MGIGLPVGIRAGDFDICFCMFLERTRKRRRVSENQEMEERLETLILRVGENSSSSLESNLEGLVSVWNRIWETFGARF